MEVDAPAPSDQQQPQQEEETELPLVRNVTLDGGRTACLALSRVAATGGDDSSLRLKVGRAVVDAMVI